MSVAKTSGHYAGHFDIIRTPQVAVSGELRIAVCAAIERPSTHTLLVQELLDILWRN
jgi:hypothetical protein